MTTRSDCASLSRRRGGRCIVNDRCDVALAVGADGVHLGQEDLPLAEARALLGHSMLIGVSTHNLAQALEAQAVGADYIGFGPIFPSARRRIRSRWLVLRDSAKYECVSGLPIVAIGGITATNQRCGSLPAPMAAAVLSAVLEAADPARAMTELMAAIQA